MSLNVQPSAAIMLIWYRSLNSSDCIRTHLLWFAAMVRGVAHVRAMTQERCGKGKQGVCASEALLKKS
jgi:hypothetical protein